MTYDSGGRYDGPFVDDRYHGEDRAYVWADGDSYRGPWMDGERHGPNGVFATSDGDVEYSAHERGEARGGGVAWNSDRTVAHTTVGRGGGEDREGSVRPSRAGAIRRAAVFSSSSRRRSRQGD